MSSEEKALHKMRKTIKSTFKAAQEAHENAMQSESDIAKYNSYLLRKLERAFAASPELDLLSALPSHYATAIEEFRTQKLPDERAIETSDPVAPLSKRPKIVPETDLMPHVKGQMLQHLHRLSTPGEVRFKAQLTTEVLAFLPQDCSQQNIIDALCQCEIIFQDAVAGDKMVLRMSDMVAVKIVPTFSGSQEYWALEYLNKFCPTVPAPKPFGMLELNSQFIMFMSYIPGKTLDNVWPMLDQRQKQIVLRSLGSILLELRSNKLPPGEVWGSVNGEGCLDRRRSLRRSVGEIRSAQDFEKFYFSEPKYGSEIWINFLRMLYKHAEDEANFQDGCVLTHSDLRMANIIVEWKGNQDIFISGLVDWQYSGFYPAYWEAVKMTNCMGPDVDSDWFLHLPAASSPREYPKMWLLDLVWNRHVE